MSKKKIIITFKPHLALYKPKFNERILPSFYKVCIVLTLWCIMSERFVISRIFCSWKTINESIFERSFQIFKCRKLKRVHKNDKMYFLNHFPNFYLFFCIVLFYKKKIFFSKEFFPTYFFLFLFSICINHAISLPTLY